MGFVCLVNAIAHAVLAFVFAKAGSIFLLVEALLAVFFSGGAWWYFKRPLLEIDRRKLSYCEDGQIAEIPCSTIVGVSPARDSTTVLCGDGQSVVIKHQCFIQSRSVEVFREAITVIADKNKA